MKRKRRNFTASFKAKVVLEALKERQSLSELAEKYQLHPNQITNWKKQFLEHADQVFSDAKSAAERKEMEQNMEELYKQIGQMKVENDWLKKKLS